MAPILQPSPLVKSGLPVAQPIVRASSLGKLFKSQSHSSELQREVPADCQH